MGSRLQKMAWAKVVLLSVFGLAASAAHAEPPCYPTESIYPHCPSTMISPFPTSPRHRPAGCARSVRHARPARSVQRGRSARTGERPRFHGPGLASRAWGRCGHRLLGGTFARRLSR